MQTELQRVLDLQSKWSPRNTPDMVERGQLVRGPISNWLREHAGELAQAVRSPVSDVLVEGRDATGLKARVPWTRFGSRARSRRATEGFYVVYLWAFDGSAVFLSLNQGTTDFVGGEFVPKSPSALAVQVAWARDVLHSWAPPSGELADLRLADPGPRSLGSGYERGDVASIAYASGHIPTDDRLIADAVAFAGALGRIYEAEPDRPSLIDTPELAAVEDAARQAAGKSPRRRAGGYRQNAEERKLIEDHAVRMAVAYYEQQGWSVRVQGAPYDLELTQGTERRTVEVKGTTTEGDAVPLTSGEVRHHGREVPKNALVVVREISLDRSTSPPTVDGGRLFEKHPWQIDDKALEPVSYRYIVPDDLYDGPGVGAHDLL
jgi:hypothetical protein